MTNTLSSIKAVIFDRDGTLIKHVPYLYQADDVELLPGVREGLKRLHEAGLLLCLHSNQSGVGRGYFKMEDVERCNARMLELIGLGDDLFAEICLAPESPETEAVFRKPSPRFARELMRRYGLQAGELCYVGDRGSDILAARKAGTCAIGIPSGLNDLRMELTELGLACEYPVVANFSEAVSLLLK